uniref:Glycolipid transfer protein n=1 Tax=Pseudonaja textilis TaxID=8673 RepID=A0A670ZYJ8_PSETE
MALLLEYEFRTLPADKQIDTEPFLEAVTHLPPFFENTGGLRIKPNQVQNPSEHLGSGEGNARVGVAESGSHLGPHVAEEGTQVHPDPAAEPLRWRSGQEQPKPDPRERHQSLRAGPEEVPRLDASEAFPGEALRGGRGGGGAPARSQPARGSWGYLGGEGGHTPALPLLQRPWGPLGPNALALRSGGDCLQGRPRQGGRRCRPLTGSPPQGSVYALPYKSDLLKALEKGKEVKEEETLEKIHQFLSKATPILDTVYEMYAKMNAELDYKA